MKSTNKNHQTKINKQTSKPDNTHRPSNPQKTTQPTQTPANTINQPTHQPTLPIYTKTQTAAAGHSEQTARRIGSQQPVKTGAAPQPRETVRGGSTSTLLSERVRCFISRERSHWCGALRDVRVCRIKDILPLLLLWVLRIIRCSSSGRCGRPVGV